MKSQQYLPAILFFLLFMISCSRHFLPVVSADLTAKYIAHIEAYNEQVRVLKASLDIKASGVMGSFIYTQADVIVQMPHYLYWSLRSFFGPPSLLLASDGQHITMYDFTGQYQNAYQVMALKEDSFVDLIDFRFHPSSLITLLLAKVPLHDSRNLDLKKAENHLEIIATKDGGWEARSIFDLEQKRVVETRLVHRGMNISYQVKYGNFQETNGIYFPRSLVLFAKSSTKFAKFIIELSEVELNGAPILPDVFYIKPH